MRESIYASRTDLSRAPTRFSRTPGWSPQHLNAIDLDTFFVLSILAA